MHTHARVHVVMHILYRLPFTQIWIYYIAKIVVWSILHVELLNFILETLIVFCWYSVNTKLNGGTGVFLFICDDTVYNQKLSWNVLVFQVHTYLQKSVRSATETVAKQIKRPYISPGLAVANQISTKTSTCPSLQIRYRSSAMLGRLTFAVVVAATVAGCALGKGVDWLLRVYRSGYTYSCQCTLTCLIQMHVNNTNNSSLPHPGDHCTNIY